MTFYIKQINSVEINDRFASDNHIALFVNRVMFVYSPQLNGKEGSLLTTRSVFNLLIDNSVFRNRYINMSIVVGNLPNMHTVYIMMDLFQR